MYLGLSLIVLVICAGVAFGIAAQLWPGTGDRLDQIGQTVFIAGVLLLLVTLSVGLIAVFRLVHAALRGRPSYEEERKLSPPDLFTLLVFVLVTLVPLLHDVRPVWLTVVGALMLVPLFLFARWVLGALHGYATLQMNEVLAHAGPEPDWRIRVFGEVTRPTALLAVFVAQDALIGILPDLHIWEGPVRLSILLLSISVVAVPTWWRGRSRSSGAAPGLCAV
ncbi:hypothetical protein [Blastococcus tunisiensis]|uniref:Uncharacterized protein n=1 Tax=Blastococcus tunisiensis TaxID=1798228 RepID=A0A1I2II42_9ACTN|nr:hypothetical protein [Blastococcus sp. DSM 46838]SFF41318.1 hypothetical protein SAMN05216574_11350 [Blastococcus sp. DSM 46838]